MFPWFSFLTYAVVTAVTPGPNNIMSMSNGSRKGFRGALPFNLGIWVGFSIVMLLCTAFCDGAVRLIPKIKLPMAGGGGRCICSICLGDLLWRGDPGGPLPGWILVRSCLAVH